LITNVESGRLHVRNEFALQRHDHVLEQELALLEPADTELIDHGVVLQAVDQVVEVPVTDAELT
jgi:hypothetical protein